MPEIDPGTLTTEGDPSPFSDGSVALDIREGDFTQVPVVASVTGTMVNARSLKCARQGAKKCWTFSKIVAFMFQPHHLEGGQSPEVV